MMDQKESDRAKFLQMMILLADKYGVTVQVNWDNGMLEFDGDVDPAGWCTLIGELELMATNWNVEHDNGGYDEPKTWEPTLSFLRKRNV